MHLRDAVRAIRVRPSSSAAVVLTLALAIGANSALFTVINSALLAPLPVQHADRLVNIYTSGALALVVASASALPLRRALQAEPVALLRME